jgi:predicted anti-sigma-YlaC factor YlaD
MFDEVQLKPSTCPTDEISAYIDGELGAERELEFDLHFATCADCTRELNLQKQFLCGLNSSLKDESELALPPDFAKHIVANAESTVAGLRRPREIYNAVFICAALLLFGLFALGAEAGRVFDGVSVVFDQVGAVGGLFGRIVYSIFLGLAIIVRSLASAVRVDEGALVIFSAIAAGALFVYVSRRALRTHRA